MEIDFTTLILELINFVILVWLLKHFLYQPILNVVDQRQSAINQQLLAAQTAKDDAANIQEEYRQRLAQIDKERQQAIRRLEEELDAKRSKTLQDIRDAAAREEEKALRARENRDQQWRREVEQQALLLATRFASKLFNRIADENTHQRLVQEALKALQTLTEEQCRQLQRQLNTGQDTIVYSALPLAAEEREQLQSCLIQQLNIQGSICYQENSELIAGIRVAVGAWTLGLNLADELKGFADCIHEPLIS